MDDAFEHLQHEDDMRSAFIAGVKEGAKLTASDSEYTQDEFRNEVRSAFWDWLDEFRSTSMEERDSQ